MDLFENLFYHYNKWVLNETKGLSNTEYGDIPRNTRANRFFLRILLAY
jgi:hypothetical protein